MGLGGSKKTKYGTEFVTKYEYKNIKFIRPVSGSTTAPKVTQKENRIYVTLNQDEEIKFIDFYSRGRRYKHIDVDRIHKINGKPVTNHVHLGYYHNEDGDREATPTEKKFVEMVKKIWQNRNT